MMEVPVWFPQSESSRLPSDKLAFVATWPALGTLSRSWSGEGSLSTSTRLETWFGIEKVVSRYDKLV